jgi:hypothetical protein
MDYYPKHFGGKRPDPETLKREGWRSFGTLVVSVSDKRLNWTEREFVKQLGERLYGGAAPKEDKRHDR